MAAATFLALTACEQATGQAVVVEAPYGPPPGALPAGVYSGPPLARLPNGPILWSSGEAATGDGETQIRAAKADYVRLARARDGLLACGLKDTRTGYFSGLTGRRSCIAHGPDGRTRELLPRGHKGQRAFEDVAVRGAVMVATSGDRLHAHDVATGRSRGVVETAGGEQRLRLPWSSLSTGPSVLSGPAAIVATNKGLVHVRLLNHGRGWRIWSQSVSLVETGLQLGPPSSAPLPPSLSRVAHDLQLTGGGLDGGRFLFGLEHPNRAYIVELTGAPTEAVVRWSGELSQLSDTGIQVTAQNGRLGLGAHGSAEEAAVVIDLRGPDPVVARLIPSQPACAVTRRLGQPPLTTVRFITGSKGLEAVTEWPGRLARCWSTQPVAP